MIRNDFVSNSSSSSYIITVDHNKHTLDDFIDDVINKTIIPNPKYDYSSDRIEELKKINYVNLFYHLKSTEMLFLGTLDLPQEHDVIYNNEENCSYYTDLKDRIDNNNLYEFEHIISVDDNKIIINMDNYISDIGINSNSSSLKYYNKTTKEYADLLYKEIYKLYKNIDILQDYHIMSITENTILNTKCLIDNGYKISLSDNMKDLDKLLESIKNKIGIYNIQVNRDGDGMDSNTIYSLSEYNVFPDYVRKLEVEIL
jgi:hypothetical protein